MQTALLLIASLVVADVAPPSRPTPADPLQPLAFLLGACWAGDLPNGMGHDTHCFAPVFGGKFVRDTHLVHSKAPDYRGETIYAWDAQARHIQFNYFSSDGDIESGVATPVEGGLDFPEHHLTQPKELTMRARWRRLDADRYEAIEEQKTPDGWKTLWRVEYSRTAAPAPSSAPTPTAAPASH